MSTYRLMPPRYPQYFERVAREMFNRGILMGARGLFGALSTPMGDVEIDRFLEAADGAAEYVLSA